MNYATIRTCDIANGEGVRVSLFVSGCTHCCKGCFNEEAWDFSYGQPFTVWFDMRFSQGKVEIAQRATMLLEQKTIVGTYE